MNEIEARRIAAVVGIIRPDWREGLVMTVLGDQRLRHRIYQDVLVAAVACYSDPTTGKPGRIHEPGHWWLTVTAVAPPATYRTITDADCAICTRPEHLHPLSPTDDHAWEPQHARAESHTPTPEQRAAIDAANVEARKTVTAEKGAEAARVVAGVDEVLRRHATTEATEDVA